MKLTNEQLAQFDESGYLFFPNLFSKSEASVLKQEANNVYASDRKEVWRESSGVARTAFAAHTYNEGFKRLGAHPRLIEPVEQLLDGPVYMHQFKVNAKAAFDGDVWQWHQDYGTWKRDDEMPEPRAMNIAVFIDDVTAANGPLLFIPGSHKCGVVAAGHDLETTSYPPSLLVHASPANISPFDRTIVYLSLCHVDNHIRAFNREEWIAHRDFAPIKPLSDNCLAQMYDDMAKDTVSGHAAPDAKERSLSGASID